MPFFSAKKDWMGCSRIPMKRFQCFSSIDYTITEEMKESVVGQKQPTFAISSERDDCRSSRHDDDSTILRSRSRSLRRSDAIWRSGNAARLCSRRTLGLLVCFWLTAKGLVFCFPFPGLRISLSVMNVVLLCSRYVSKHTLNNSRLRQPKNSWSVFS